MKTPKLFTLLFLSILFFSCAELETVMNETINENFGGTQTRQLTEEEVVKGL